MLVVRNSTPRLTPGARVVTGSPMLVLRNKLVWAASILALVAAAKLWFVQGIFRPVRIAGASMAETLRGAHCQLDCGDCGFRCRYDAERPPAEDRVVCPNCGYVNRDLHAAVSLPGQRVLIDRLGYRFHLPRRWDLIAFRSDGDPNYLEVKRVVGLPGERIAIRRGDVYVDGRIASKTLPQFRDTAVLVYDSGFEPRRTSGLPARWRATADSSWTRIPGGFYRRSASQRGTEADWLTYHHWRCFASPLPRTDEYAVLDNYGYNQDESRQLHRVGDLMLVAHLRLADEDATGGGSVTLRGYDGRTWSVAVLEFPVRRASLYRGSACVTSAPLPPAAYARDVLLEFALFDRQVILSVDGRVVIAWQDDGDADAGSANRTAERTARLPRPSQSVMNLGLGTETPQPGTSAAPRLDDTTEMPASSQPFGIAADGLCLVIRRLQVFRDVHYLDPRGLGRDWCVTTPLGSDEVLVLGDNVPVSRDSRHREQPGVPTERILGPVLRIGK
jgi:signal peptidase I